MKRKISNIWNSLKLPFKRSRFEPKIFCIGYNKTGTTSLGRSLKLLGYDHSSFNQKLFRKSYKLNKINEVLKYTSKFESFDDLPWLKEDMIPILDKTFPKSKYIYLTREEEAWKKSIVKWTKKLVDKEADPEKRWNDYLNHQKFVLEFFENRPNDLLTLDIKDPKGFDKLAKFLGKKAPHSHFPHFNKT